MSHEFHANGKLLLQDKVHVEAYGYVLGYGFVYIQYFQLVILSPSCRLTLTLFALTMFCISPEIFNLTPGSSD